MIDMSIGNPSSGYFYSFFPLILLLFSYIFLVLIFFNILGYSQTMTDRRQPQVTPPTT